MVVETGSGLGDKPLTLLFVVQDFTIAPCRLKPTMTSIDNILNGAHGSDPYAAVVAFVAALFIGVGRGYASH